VRKNLQRAPLTWQRMRKKKLGSRRGTRVHNTGSQAPGIPGNPKNAKSFLDCWEIADDMIDLILKNMDEIERKQVN
jgi:hypothetical protein